MRALTANEIIAVWERGANASPSARALLLLAAASDDASTGQLEQLPVGQRDTRLLELRERMFGSQLPCLATCPACSENLECNLCVADLLASNEHPSPTAFLPLPRGEGEGRGEGVAPIFSLQTAEYQTTFRLPTGGDLAFLSPEADVSENRHRLFQTCLLSAQRSGAEIAADDLPPEVMTAVVERMTKLDPQADLQLRLQCPECAHEWEAPFDIVSYLWTEFHGSAVRLLREIHEIASAYHWPEADILALSLPRRQAYLELIRG